MAGPETLGLLYISGRSQIASIDDTVEADVARGKEVILRSPMRPCERKLGISKMLLLFLVYPEWHRALTTGDPNRLWNTHQAGYGAV